MKHLLLICFLINSYLSQSVQINHIGLNSTDLKEIMADQDSDFLFNNELEIRKGKIIKYVDKAKTKTLIYVLDKKDCCRYYMIMYDYIYIDSIISDLDGSFKRINDHTWIEVIDGIKYNKYLKKEDWYFTVITKKVKK